MHLFMYDDINFTDTVNTTGSTCTYCYLKELHVPLDFRVILTVTLSSIAALSLFWNLVLLGVIMRKRQLRTLNNAFIINLVVTDLSRVVFFIPMEVDSFLYGYHRFGFLGCQWKNFLFFLSLPSTSYGLLLLTLERYVRIKYALRYDFVVTHFRVFIVLTLNWTYNILMGSIAGGWAGNITLFAYGKCNVYLAEWYKFYVLVANLLVPTTILLMLNVLLFVTANRKSNSVASIDKQTGELRYKRHLIANVKAAKTISLLLGAFIMCWIPYTSIVIVNTVCKVPCYVKLRPILKALNVVNYSNSLWNPLLYGLCNRTFKKEIRILLRCLWPCRKRHKSKSNSTSSAPLWFVPDTKFNETSF